MNYKIYTVGYNNFLTTQFFEKVEILKNSNIILLCSCQNVKICHRLIVSEKLNNIVNTQVIEILPGENNE